jgi:carbamate kinase
MGNLLPIEVPFAGLLTMIEVDAHDPAFKNPTKFIGPVYDKTEADRIAADKQWTFKQDGQHGRRVVPSPKPKRIFEIRPIRWLLDRGTIVIRAGGGGIPTAYDTDSRRRTLEGVEVVIDKDFAGALLARDLQADMYIMATDADGVYLDWGKPNARKLDRVTPDELAAYEFPAGSMGPKIEAACEFARATGKPAAIGALADIERIAAHEAGTLIETGRLDDGRIFRDIRLEQISEHLGSFDSISAIVSNATPTCRSNSHKVCLRLAHGRVEASCVL